VLRGGGGTQQVRWCLGQLLVEVAYALAADHPDNVERLAVAEAVIAGVTPSPPLIGTSQANDQYWHILEHQPDHREHDDGCLPAAQREALARDKLVRGAGGGVSPGSARQARASAATRPRWPR
jgi:pimeloyl-ACP methyl ester carboxylesterase